MSVQRFLCLFLVIFMMLGMNGAALSSDATISPRKSQPVKAKIIDKTPKNFTISVKSFSNMAVNEEAPYFAVYTSSQLPQKCGNFRDLDLKYSKPSKYERVFDLSKNVEVINAVNEYKCVVIKNIPLQ